MVKGKKNPQPGGDDWDEGTSPFDVEYGSPNAGPVKKSSRAGRCGVFFKILCTLLFLFCVIVGILVWQKVIWFYPPTADYVPEDTAVFITAANGAYEPTFSVKIAVEVENKNTYALTFKDVKLDLLDFQDTFVGTATHPGVVKVPAKGSSTFVVEAEVHATAEEVAALGANCALNDMKTRATAKGTVKGLLAGTGIPFKLGPYVADVKCNML